MTKQWWQKEIVYQIYPKSFYDTNGDGIGDIPGITEKLGYLKSLGVTMLWICPVFKSPMDDNGYDISDYLSLAPEFGTMQDLDCLIKRAAELEIKVILDLVINHTSDEHPWFKKALVEPESLYHDWYIFKEGSQPPNNWRSVFGGSCWEKVPDREEYYFHAFGKKQPDLNWENPTLRQALYNMVNHWLDRGIAGFRVDAITFIKKDLTFADKPADGADGLVKCTKTCRNQPGIGAFLGELKKETFDRFKCVTVAEAPGVPYEQLGDFIGENGYFSMIFDFRHADLEIASGNEWFKRIDWKVSDLRERLLGSQLAVQKYGWSANFIENHDQPRSTTKYLREHAQNRDAVKMLAAMYFFLRGTPFIYQGQELGMTNFTRSSMDPFNDLSSIDQYQRALSEGLTEAEALHIVNLRSRDNARTPFPWRNALYGGFSTAKPWLEINPNYPEINAESQLADPDSVLAFYRRMISFRQQSPHSECLIYGAIEPEAPQNSQVISYLRRGVETIYCAFNFSAEPVVERIPGVPREAVFSNLPEVKIQNNTMHMAPFQAVLVQLI